MKRKWKVLPPPPQTFFDQFPELPPIVANLLYHRGLHTQETIDEFLNPDYSEDVHDPFLFRDIEKAVARLFRALENQELVTIHGDYDADGVSASVILSSLFRALGVKHDTFLPHREIDGYGLNTNTIKLLHERGTKVIVTCDCGISNCSEITLANELGIDVIITDHHTIPPVLPPAHAIIHPNISGETYPDKGLAGGGVAFKFAQAILRTHAKNHDRLPNNERHEAFEKWLLDMVAIASVADMVPLLGESRTLTKYGLIVLSKTRRLGLQKLLLTTRLKISEPGRRELTAENIAFHIAPRINAAGRMKHANIAFNLLTCEDPTNAAELAQTLDQNNQDRQKKTEELVRAATEQIETSQMDKPVLFVLGDEWAAGIIGLVASKIKEAYQKPTIAMTGNGTIVGSGRSVEGFNLIAALQEMPQFFSKFGGHPMACGFSLKSRDLLNEFFETLIAKFEEKTAGLDLSPTFNIDAELALENVNWELYDILDKFKPFGVRNEKPKYLAKNVTVMSLEPVGADGRHLRIMIRNGAPKIIKTIGWNLCGPNSETNWCLALRPGDKIDMVFEIDINEWNGNRELQLTIVDLKKN